MVHFTDVILREWKRYVSLSFSSTPYPILAVNEELNPVNFHQRLYILLVFPSRSCLFEDYGIFFQVKRFLVFHKKVGDTLWNISLLDKIYVNQLLKIGPFAAQNVVTYRRDAVSTTTSRLNMSPLRIDVLVFEKTSLKRAIYCISSCYMVNKHQYQSHYAWIWLD